MSANLFQDGNAGKSMRRLEGNVAGNTQLKGQEKNGPKEEENRRKQQNRSQRRKNICNITHINIFTA
jgi:hypothetical protein